jgi:hypothetical protein
MIQLAALKALPWKAILQVVAAGLLALLVYLTVTRAWVTLPEVRAELKAEKAKLEAEVKCGEGSACAKRVEAAKVESDRINQEAVDQYEKELEELRNRPLPTRVIRVCPAPGNVRDAASAGGAGQGPTAEGLVSGANEFDTRPLRDLAILADEVSARCRALLERDRALSKVGK